MAVWENEWLITSDVAHEVAFRVDVPERGRGRWVLSYLPTTRRLTRERALAGVRLAELILLGLPGPTGEFDTEAATLHAALIGLGLTEAMCLLALRDTGGDVEAEPCEEAETRTRRPIARCRPWSPGSREAATGVRNRPGREAIR
ncbi:hypothetical protein ABZ412_18015 [Nocardia sp. NPDC005746]|uniref:hypothetical protein n=1 Tax=Nocardia sp. NPDC005746 TaxID=3157062 RepID=UPI0033C91D62